MSINLKKNITTPKGLQIIKRAERALLNERVRSINNTLNMLRYQRDTCIDQLRRVLSNEWMDKCKEFIEVGREQQHLKTMNRQKEKFNRLLDRQQVREGKCTALHGGHEGNHSNLIRHNNALENRRENTCVRNLSTTSLTQDQVKALSNGHNYAIVPKVPPVGEYITTIENVCNQLQQGKAEELRGEIQTVLKKIQVPRHNISREERKAIEELRRDKNRIILTVDKGVSMVVMDRGDYTNKAEELLQQSAYRPIPNDPTNRLKTRLISLLKQIKTEGGMNEATYKGSTLQGQDPPSSMDCPRFTSREHH